MRVIRIGIKAIIYGMIALMLSSTPIPAGTAINKLKGLEKTTATSIVKKLKSPVTTFSFNTKLTKAQMNRVIKAVNEDEFAYAGDKMIINSGVSRDGKLRYTVDIAGSQYFREIGLLHKKIAKKTYAKCKGLSTRKKINVINDYLCNLITYVSVGQDNYLSFLKRNRGNCVTYANLFWACCKYNGIKCSIVSGYGDGAPHAFNKVKIGAKSYYVDVCWNDTGGNRTKYLMSSKLWSNHSLTPSLSSDETTISYELIGEGECLPIVVENEFCDPYM